jgi:hypothetical protein
MRIPPSARIAILALVLFSFGPLAAGRAVPSQAALPPLPPFAHSGNTDFPANASAASNEGVR